MYKAFFRFALISICIFYYSNATAQQVFILGVAQDAGNPHIGCIKPCCLAAKEKPELKQMVVSVAVTDTIENKWWLFEATPDMTGQLDLFKRLTNSRFSYLPAAVFITHAHIGHYTGLMYFGREALNTSGLPVYTLPLMSSFLLNNGPWSQLVSLKNISLQTLKKDSTHFFTRQFSVAPILVPHRDEYSETAGFKIITGSKTVLFIPDIDKWEKWNKNIVHELQSCHLALIDATFYSEGELQNRNMSEIPHPLVTETIKLFSQEPTSEKKKIHFIHFNHTNPLLFDSEILNLVESQGFNVCKQGDVY